MIKYGVVAQKDLEEDLRHWRHLYLAGRLHKPVRMLSEPDPASCSAMATNHRHAFNTALLQLPHTFSKVPAVRCLDRRHVNTGTRRSNSL
jgi:translocator assembly and maintenance protein 41